MRRYNSMKNGPSLNIKYAEDIRFERPRPPSYDTIGSILSIFSLLLMTILSTIMATQLLNPAINFGLEFLPPPQASSALATWAWAPFAFTVWGAGRAVQRSLLKVIESTDFRPPKAAARRSCGIVSV